ncbi:uncharacterized protein LOC114743434, partial [Neltuma alba]|uniref:uncharacterized protein LOC114743434 n=1 Tax=Neltuma alba TaxID=207710 RepID=UPI0010A58594
MDDCLPSPKTPSTLRRWHSIPTSVVVPPRADSYAAATHTPRPSVLDLDFGSIKSPSSYTSLRDVLPSSAAAVNSPTASSAATNSSYHISIRNRLVKQAAWAYLQPLSASPQSSSGPNILRRLSLRFSSCFR